MWRAIPCLSSLQEMKPRNCFLYMQISASLSHGNANCISLRDNPKVLAQLQQKLFLLWGPLEEQLSNVAYSPSPKPIRKASRQKSSTSTSKSLRFSDDIDADDGSSSSLNERYGWEDGNGGRSGGKIVKARQGGLGHEELGKGVWFTAGIMEVWTARSEACFMEKRWILFGTRIE